MIRYRFSGEELPVTPPAVALDDEAWLPHQHQSVPPPATVTVWMVEEGATAFALEAEDGWIPRARRRRREPVRQPQADLSEELPTPPAAFGLEEAQAPAWRARPSRPTRPPRRLASIDDGLVQPPPPFALDEECWFVLRRAATSPPRRLATGADDELVPPPTPFGLEEAYGFQWPRLLPRLVRARVALVDEEWVAPPVVVVLEEDYGLPRRVHRASVRLVRGRWYQPELAGAVAPPVVDVILVRNVEMTTARGTAIAMTMARGDLVHMIQGEEP